jgi:hypothetical protein
MCKICLMPAATRKRIDAELYLGTSYKKIAVRFSTNKRSISHVAVFRHRKHLIPQDVVRRPPPPDPQVATTLLGRVEQLIAEFRSIADATKAQQPPWAIAAMKEIMHGLEMIGKITGEIQPGNFNFNTFNFANVTEEQIGAFWEALQKTQNARVRGLLMARLGLRAPDVHVNFVDVVQRCSNCGSSWPLPPAPPLLEAPPTNGNGHV